MFADRAPRRRLLILSLAACLVAALSGALSSSATAGKPGGAKPDSSATIVIDSITAGNQAPVGTPDGAVPTVLVAKGQPFSVHVRLVQTGTEVPATLKSDTKLSITTSAGPLTPSVGVLPAGASTTTLTTSLATAANQVSLTVSADGVKGPVTVFPGTSASGASGGEPSQLFDVLSELRYESASPAVAFTSGIGGGDNCTNATPDAPVCGVVILPEGAASSQVMLSLGLCDKAYAGCGDARGSVVQALANLSGLYSKSAPATILIKCDKVVCGTGAIQNKTLNFSLLGNAALKQAEACPAKGTIGADQDACVDYVQSRRDGSGDTHLYLLIDKDARISVH